MISGVKDKKNKAQKGKKNKLVLAKDPKEATLAIIVLSVFICTTIYNIVNYYKSEYPSAPVVSNAEADNMAKKRADDLANLQDPQNPVSPNEMPQDANNIYNQTLKLKGESPQNVPPGGVQNGSGVATKAPMEDDVEIISLKDSKYKRGKKILITIEGSGRSNPFLPASENYGAPPSLPKFALIPPPEQMGSNPDTSAVMGTTISGILYDKYSPSAIITIAGTDYLVKKGDVINRYNILSISKDQVVVQLGKNVYKAGVGELLAQGQMNYNAISNLNKKFGGNEVSINVKKKGY